MPNTALSPAQIEQYSHDGFIIIRGFLTPQELEEWRADLDAAVAARGPLSSAAALKIPQWHPALSGPPVAAAKATPVEQTTSDSSRRAFQYSQVFTQRVNLWMTSPSMRSKMFDPALGKMVAQLTGVDGVRIWHDQTLIKEPWGNPTAMHVDNPNWGYSSHGATSIWVALDDATEANGCLYFIRGSHKVAKLGVRAGGAGSPNVGDGIFDVYPELESQSPVAAVMNAGDCSFHSGLMAHGAGANMTAGRRRAMTCAYMPDGCVYNGTRNVLPQEYVETISVGDELNDDWLNPLIYSADPSRRLSQHVIGEVYLPKL